MITLGIYVCFIKSVILQEPQRCQIVTHKVIIAFICDIGSQNLINKTIS